MEEKETITDTQREDITELGITEGVMRALITVQPE